MYPGHSVRDLSGCSPFDSFGGALARPSLFDPTVRRPRRALRAGVPEVSFFQTDDGKQLRLTRYNGGRKGPVLLLHGLGVSSLIFSIDTIETNLVEYLCAAGYDCWLLDYRASIELPYCREQWTADTVAERDYRPAIEQVRAKTGATTVQVVGHCFGGLTFTMAMLKGLPYVRAVAISQIAAHAIVPFWPQRLLAYLHTPDLMSFAGVSLVDARASTTNSALERAMDGVIGLAFPFRAEDRSKSLTSRRITALYGQLYDLAQLNQATFDALPEMFGEANITAFRHLSAIARAGHVVRADGSEGYLADGDIRNFAVPTLFVHGAHNHCFTPPGTRKTMAEFARVNGGALYERREVAETGHIDCIFGKNAARDVFPLIVAHLDRTATA